MPARLLPHPCPPSYLLAHVPHPPPPDPRPAAATVGELLKALAEKQGWQPADTLLRLEGAAGALRCGVGVGGSAGVREVMAGGRMVPAHCQLTIGCGATHPTPRFPHPALHCNAPLTALPPTRTGFVDPWERVLFRGRELRPDASLAEQGVGGGAELTAVRRVLVADGWKVGVCGWGGRGWGGAVSPGLPGEQSGQLLGPALPHSERPSHTSAPHHPPAHPPTPTGPPAPTIDPGG